MNTKIMLEELHQHWHAMANHLTVATLTMERCGAAENLKEKDFQLLQLVVTQVVQHLVEAREVIEHLENTLPAGENQPPQLLMVLDNGMKGKQVLRPSFKNLVSVYPIASTGTDPD